jgi:hypothetical protein
MSNPTCRCGCYRVTSRHYAPGHDARHVSQLYTAIVFKAPLRGASPDLELARALSGLSDRLGAKLVGRIAAYGQGQPGFTSIWDELESDDWFSEWFIRYVDRLIRAAGCDPTPMTPQKKAALLAGLGWDRAKINYRAS